MRLIAKKINNGGIVMRGGSGSGHVTVSHATETKLPLMQKIKNYLKGCWLRLITWR